MNILEAAKTGRKIRRAGWVAFIDPQYYELVREDILASDWEVEPDTPRFTLAECKDLLTKGIKYNATYSEALLKSVLYHLEFVNEYSLSSRSEEQVPTSSMSMGIEKL